MIGVTQEQVLALLGEHQERMLPREIAEELGLTVDQARAACYRLFLQGRLRREWGAPWREDSRGYVYWKEDDA